ncbi:hypothetical protein Tco_0250301 [Tanacetum coccineum]
MFVIEQPIPPAPAADSTAKVLADWNAVYDAHNEELKSIFEKQDGVERFDLIQTLHACKQEEGKLVRSYVLKMKGYLEQLERLGYVLPQDLSVGLILNGLTSDFTGFVRSYNMHNMGKTIGELHALFIEYEKGLPKKATTPQVMMTQGGRIQKSNKKSQNAKGKGKGKGKGKDKPVYIPKPKNPKPSAKENPAKDDACHTIRRFCYTHSHYVPTKKVDKTPYQLWYGTVPNLSYLKEIVGYYFYFPPKNKIVVASEIPAEIEIFNPTQEEIAPVYRSVRTHRALERLCLNVEVEEHSAVDWKSSKQSTTAMSAIEAEYIAASEAAMEAIWIRKLIAWLGIVPTINEPIKMLCDNSAALLITSGPRIQRGARHYHRRYHYIRECIELGEINLLKVHTDDNLADPFTKTLPKGKLTQHARSIELYLASSFM